MNPTCNTALFQLFSSGKINSIEELAHVIAKSSGGPRGKAEITDRDSYENIIILCPNCHTKIDKNPDEYSEDDIYRWKKEHISKIDSSFETKTYSSRQELRKTLEKYLSENRKIFESYGPHSKIAQEKPNSDVASQWNKMSTERIIPNNRAMERLILTNSELLSQEEIELFEEFKLHINDFEMNKMGISKITEPKTFPKGFENILIDE